MMIKVANTSVKSDWPQVVDLGKVDYGEQTVFRRPAPAEPLAFFSGHEYGSKVYTNGADRDAIVAPTFRQTIFIVLGGVKELNLNRLGWGDEDAMRLATVLPLCAQLRRLELVYNSISDRGIMSIASAIAAHGRFLTNLSHIKLTFNPYGEDGLSALANCLRDARTLPSLVTLKVNQPHAALKRVCERRGVTLQAEGSKAKLLIAAKESGSSFGMSERDGDDGEDGGGENGEGGKGGSTTTTTGAPVAVTDRVAALLQA